MSTDTAGATTKLDPAAAIEKYAAKTQASAAADQATIQRVEAAIRNSPMGWLQAQLGEVSSKASSEQGAVEGKVDEHRQLVAENQKDAPKDAGPAPRLSTPTRPAVSQPQSAGTAKGGAAGAPKAVAPAGKAIDGKAPAKAVSRAPAGALPGPPGMVASMVGAKDDAELDRMLDAYQPRNPQGPQMIGRVAQMKGIAEGFNGQLDTYIAQGGAVEQGIASAANFLGMGKDVKAVWAGNPYRKVAGTLGSIMTGLSAIKSVTSIVGSICGKIGLVLTVVGLLGMIFPPIGAAVSGIARILNAVGVICDVISFVISAILTGLNGVVLARQIAAGASAEEKAATADLLISEANDAAAGAISLAQKWGPKFWKGMSSGSKGIIGGMIRRAKAVIGRVSLKLTGNIRAYATRLVRRMGFGGVNVTRVDGAWKGAGVLSKAKASFDNTKVGKFLNSSPLDKVQDKLMAKYGSTNFAKRLDRIGAWGASTGAKLDIETRVGDWMEKKGAALGNLGQSTSFAKNMTSAAVTVENQTKQMALDFARKDAMELERMRWQRQAGTTATETGGEKISLDQRAALAGKAHDRSVFEAAKAAKEKEEKDAYVKKLAEDPEFREKHLQKMHKSRERVWVLEERYAKDDARRNELKELAGNGGLDTAQKRELRHLDGRLRELDQMRGRDSGRQGQFNELMGIKPGHAKNWYQAADITWNALEPWLQNDITDTLKELKVRQQVRKSVKWDGSAAKGAAAKAAGQATFAEIATDAMKAQMADFSSFVRAGREGTSTAATVRSMLGAAKNQPTAPATAPSAPTAAANQNAPAAQPGGAAPTQAAATQTQNLNTSVTSAGPATAPQQPAPAPTPAPAPQTEEGGGEGADPIAYWPALIPEFDKAAGEFGFMRRVAVEFKSAQIKAKQKAVDTLAIFGRYQEYAKLRQAAAQKNQQGATETQGDAQKNVSSAEGTAGQAGRGEAKQNEAKSTASNRAAVALPEPETGGFWGRIIGRVKKWAKDKAAQLFGWIQEKIASVILRGLCGVSMGDLKDYAGALRRQQQAAHQVAGTAAASSEQAEQKQITLGAGAAKDAQSAANAIGECDANILEADNFMADVASFEQQLAQEKAHAQAFLGQVRAAVHAEQARKRAEEEQRAREEAAAAQQAAAQQAAAQQGGEGAEVTAPDPAPAAADVDQDGVPDATEAAMARAELQSATGYVKAEGTRMVGLLEYRAADYKAQLRQAMTNRTGEDAAGNDLRAPAEAATKSVIDQFKGVVENTRKDMDEIAAQDVDPTSAGRLADMVIQAAEQLDTSFGASLQGLDDTFEATYAAIREGRRNFKTRVLDGDHVIGDVNRGATNLEENALDTATAWANPVADFALTPFSNTGAG